MLLGAVPGVSSVQTFAGGLGFAGDLYHGAAATSFNYAAALTFGVQVEIVVRGRSVATASLYTAVTTTHDLFALIDAEMTMDVTSRG